jgi:uncharacterized membrane protein YebE (DUF533 family)
VALDLSKLRDTLQAIHAELTPTQANAIVDIARFAASADGRMDINEMGTIAQVAKVVMGMAGQPDVVVPAQPITAARLSELGHQLQSAGARELAYAAAMLVVHADRKLTDSERDFAATLATITSVEPARAKELEEQMAALLAR